jgi:hypothetical protein
MPFSIYDAAIPVLVRALNNLDHLLDLGLASAEARKIDPAVFTQARLAPDMLPLTGQVWLASEMAARSAARLAGVETPNYPYVEQTFEELKARIATARDYISAFTREQIEGGEDREFTVKLGPEERPFTGASYLMGFTLPNVYFHITTAYDILRHNGVELTKTDYMGDR